MAVLNPRYALLTVAYCIMIFILSSMPYPERFSTGIRDEDKVAHCVLYGGLAFVVSMGLRKRGRPVRPSVQFLAPVLFAFLYGISDECHQFFVPGRTADPWDACSDALGGLLVQIVLCFFVWRLHRVSGKPENAPRIG
jgi:VanZ family protein